MKKFKLCFIFILVLVILTSCTNKKNEKPNIIEEQGTDKKNETYLGYDKRDIEPNINFKSLKEERKLTNSVLENGSKDYTLLKRQDLKEGRKKIDISKLEIIQSYKTTIPNNVNVDLIYNKYLMPYDYILINSNKTKIYDSPAFNGKVLEQLNLYDKVKLIYQVKGEYVNETKNNKWYCISCYDKNGQNFYGFIPGGSGISRKFRFNNMYTPIKKLENEIQKYNYGYIYNYKDINGTPPLPNGKGVDKYGVQAYQSAPAYFNLNDKSNFRYFPDGMIVFILGETDGYFKVRSVDYDGEYYIPKRYISFDDNLDKFTKAVVVDTKNQNEAVFEKRDNQWTLISYALATTGVEGKYRYKTTPGTFKVMEMKGKFYYLDDETREVTGYAPYGIRFSQGAYIHGVPVEFEYENGKKVEPEMEEYLFTIGSIPRSHKCVRNYTSHAKFLYNWVDTNDTAVIVID